MVNLSAVTSEALSKSDLLWLRTPERERATWFAVVGAGTDLPDGSVLLVSGGGEPDLGALPDPVELVLRSKGDGRRLLVLQARALALDPADERWQPAAETALAARLNAYDGTLERWREGATLWLLSPFGQPLDSPAAAPSTELVAAPVRPSAAAPQVRRPWHLGGRRTRRR